LLIGFYIAVFIMAAFTSDDYLAVAFDSGGVTTGPITVPFILALGVGLSGVLGGKSSHDDSFGLVALCSIGPIMAVMIMGMFYDSSSTGIRCRRAVKTVCRRFSSLFQRSRYRTFTDYPLFYYLSVFSIKNDKAAAD